MSRPRLRLRRDGVELGLAPRLVPVLAHSFVEDLAHRLRAVLVPGERLVEDLRLDRAQVAAQLLRARRVAGLELLDDVVGEDARVDLAAREPPPALDDHADRE